MISLCQVYKLVAQGIESPIIDGGQTISTYITGPIEVETGQVASYSSGFQDQNGFAVFPPIGIGTWDVYGGISEVVGNTEIQIQWTTPGIGTIQYYYTTYDNYYYASLNVSIVGIPAPNTSFNLIYNCGSTQVQRLSNPQSDYEWWWQTSSTGTSTTLGNGLAITRTVTGDLYLRARLKVAPYTWSNTSQYIGNVIVYTSPPSIPIANQSCRYGQGSLTLSVQPTVGATGYKWYTVANGGSAIEGNNSTSLVIDTDKTKTYYVSAYAGGCESNRVSVTGTVFSPPEIFSASNGVLHEGGTVQLTTVNVHDTYTWYNSNNQTIGNLRTVTVSAPGQYRVQVSDCNNGISSYSLPYDVWFQSTGPNMNYVITNKIFVSGVNDVGSIKNLPNTQNERIIQYYDGLGRPLQSVNKASSPLGNDMVVPFVYDKFGKQYREYLPVVLPQNSGIYRQGILDWTGNYSVNFYNQPSSSISNDTRPFSEIQFEKSPEFRPAKSFGPGIAWFNGDYSLKNEYKVNRHGTNAGEERIIIWRIIEQTNSLPIIEQDNSFNSGFYASGHLNVNLTYDEHGNDTKEYIDKLGRVVVKKVLLSSSPSRIYAETHFIYDEIGNLRVVISPEGVSKLNTEYLSTGANKESFLKRWAFRYKYDSRNRLVEKQIPGTETTFLIYDNRNRLVMTQDGVQRPLRKWSFIKYDAVNRPIMTGIYTHNSVIDRVTMNSLISTNIYSESFNGNTSNHGYTNNQFPTTGIEVLTVTYYDNYDFKTLLSNSFDYVNSDILGQRNSEFKRVRGQITGTKINILNSTNYLWTVNYYDDKYRLIQTISQNHKGGIDRFTDLYDFVRLTNSKVTHSIGTTTNIVSQRYTYDHNGRLLNTFHKVNNNPEIVLSSNTYNELGQRITKKIHSEDQGLTYKQHIDYRFNIRGWLSRINNSDLSKDGNEPRDHFGLNLYYNDFVNGINNQLMYNGNISATTYSTNQGFDPVLKERGYKYDYDAMSRLTSATHYEKTANWNVSSDLHEDNITYDLNTNMRSIRRKGLDGIQLDNLTLSYTGNQLQTVSDLWDTQKGFKDGNTSGNDYSYNANGSRITDKNKGIINTDYNYMNLRDRVAFSDGNYLLYGYDATGIKLSQRVYNSTNVLQKQTDYIEDFFYENDSLKYILHEEGRYNKLTEAYEYELRDHLGNNRVTFTTKEANDKATASLETDKMMEEKSKFLRYENSRRISSHLFDRTNGVSPSSIPGYAVRLNGTSNEKYGLARSFAVLPGDKVKAEVYAKFIDNNSNNWTTALRTLLTQVTAGTAPAGTVVDGGSYSSSTSSFPFPGLVNTSSSIGNGPKAYLNWLVFDQDLTFVDGGFVRMSDVAKEFGQDCAHEFLSAEVEIKTPGFVYIYLSNENETPVEVYFDQFSVELQKSPVINSTELYPYGAPSISYAREFSMKQNRLLNGKETQDELGYNAVDLGQRDIDPFVPVFPAIDRFSEKYFSMSPYQFTTGNPVLYVDINGDSIVNPHKSELQAIADDLNRIYSQKYGEDNVFSVQERTRSVERRTNDWSIWDPSTWGNAFEDPEYETVQVTDYVLTGSENFDWSRDKYTEGMSDLMQTSQNIVVDIIADNGTQYKQSVRTSKNGLLKDYGGGFTVESNYLILSNQLKQSTPSNKFSWTLGGVALHELLYHVHPSGKDEGGNPNTMRSYYGLRNGREHGSGSKHIKIRKKK